MDTPGQALTFARRRFDLDRSRKPRLRLTSELYDVADDRADEEQQHDAVHGGLRRSGPAFDHVGSADYQPAEGSEDRPTGDGPCQDWTRGPADRERRAAGSDAHVRYGGASEQDRGNRDHHVEPEQPSRRAG